MHKNLNGFIAELLNYDATGTQNLQLSNNHFGWSVRLHEFFVCMYCLVTAVVVGLYLWRKPMANIENMWFVAGIFVRSTRCVLHKENSSVWEVWRLIGGMNMIVSLFWHQGKSYCFRKSTWLVYDTFDRGIDIISLIGNAASPSDGFVTSKTISVPMATLHYLQDRRVMTTDSDGRLFLLDIDCPEVKIEFQHNRDVRLEFS